MCYAVDETTGMVKASIKRSSNSSRFLFVFYPDPSGHH